jgi:gliding motility-associated protein GldM
MALPKEPRQKMINLMYLVLTALLALNVSSEILNAFKVVDKSLMNSSGNIDKANGTLYNSLQEKLKDVQSAEKAKIWEPKAQQAKKLSDDLNKYIDDLKLELKKEAGLEMVDGKEKFKEDNLEAATRLFGSGEEGKKRGPDLESKLKAYRDAILAIDPSIKTKFESTLPVEITPPIGQDGLQKDFTNGYFHMTPTVAALTILSKFQNNVKNAENQVVTYCHDQIGQVVVKMDKAAVLVGQSSNYVMPNQEVVITAGVGAYSSAGGTSISINGAGVPVIDGKGTYKLTASGAGSHKVNVTVRYKDQDGNDQTKTEEIEYIVGTPSGASVSADKMNVFYIGVDNPVTVSPGVGWDKASASLSGNGSMSGSGDNRTVRVSGGDVTINVTAENKTTPFKFRVKTIPDPYAMIGPSKGGKMASNVFKAQDFIRAQLDNFDFDVKFTVVSATVYFGGAGFQTGGGVQTGTVSNGSLGGIKDKMNLCKPGSIVSFDDIKVVGPDGRTRTIPPITFVLN